jgi:hypothetical protein
MGTIATATISKIRARRVWMNGTRVVEALAAVLMSGSIAPQRRWTENHLGKIIANQGIAK